jgi:hypothetical protein
LPYDIANGCSTTGVADTAVVIQTGGHFLASGGVIAIVAIMLVGVMTKML